MDELILECKHRRTVIVLCVASTLLTLLVMRYLGYQHHRSATLVTGIAAALLGVLVEKMWMIRRLQQYREAMQRTIAIRTAATECEKT